MVVRMFLKKKPQAPCNLILESEMKYHDLENAMLGKEKLKENGRP